MAINIKAIPFKESLWTHQLEALKEINRYVRKRDKDWSESCMIALPTGVGKTGVIATFSHFSSFSKILVLSPRSNITNQNFENIDGLFFKKLGYEEELIKNVVNKIPSRTDFCDKIVVSTIQKISDMHTRSAKGKNPPVGECTFEFLALNVDLLIIDEGHWEPADTWKNFLRKFNCPKVLFTATPIRNDYSKFNVKKGGYFYTKSLVEFQKEKYLKQVKFVELSSQDSLDDFTLELAHLRDKYPQSVNNKMLVRCENSAEIEFLVRALGLRFPRENVIGVHVNFPSWTEEDNCFFTNKTPIKEREKEKYDIWVHQYKMVEGFDEPKFGYLVIFSPFSNARQLVQQVGRVLRNPSRSQGEVGYVFSPSFGHQETLWDNYIEYDQKTIKEKNSVLNTMDFDYSQKLFKDTDLVYLDKSFRKKFKAKEEEFHVDERFLLPLSCNIKSRLCDEEKIQEIYEQVKDDFLSSAIEVLFNEQYDDGSFVVFYLEIKNSPYIKFEQVVETVTQVVYFRELENYFLFYSSSPSFSSFFDELGLSGSISEIKFQKLISIDPNSRVSNVYLKNSAVSSTQYSSKKLWASDVSKVPPSFDDSFHTLSNVWGFSHGPRTTPSKTSLVEILNNGGNETARRYIGHKKGRITQDSKIRYNIREYNEWSDKIVQILDSNTSSHSLFNRFAAEVEPPEVIDPYMISFDFDLFAEYISDKIVKVDSSLVMELHQIISIANICLELNNNEFKIESENLSRSFLLKVEWDDRAKRFIVSSNEDDQDSFDKYFVYDAQGKKIRSLLDLINSKQAFKLFLNGNDALMFVDKKFIKPNFNLPSHVNQSNDPVLSVLKPVPAFSSVVDEKGHSVRPQDWSSLTNNWPTQCLFGVLSNRGNGITELDDIFNNIETLICDDMDTEAADFIAVTDKRISLIHGKSVKNVNQTACRSKCGASNIHEVISQAVKNLKVINLFDPQTPKYVDRWGTVDWLGSGNGSHARINRRVLPTSGPRGINIWNKRLLPKIKNPNVDRYAVCMITHGFNKDYFRRILDDPSHGRHTEAVHSYFLILNLISAAQQLGVKVELYCNP